MLNVRRHVILVLVATAIAAPASLAQTTPRFTVEHMLALKRLSDPQWSPDGTRVAFVQTEVNLDANTRSNEVVVLRVGDSVVLRRLEGATRPRWSPDGRHLAFTRTGGNGEPAIWVTDLDRSLREVVAFPTGAGSHIWSPDGKWMAFVSEVFPECAGDVLGDAACNDTLLKKRAAVKTKARLIDGLLFRHWVSWREDRYSHLFVAPADGSAPPRDLTPGSSDVPPFSLGGPEDYAFAPDSKEIAFVRKTGKVEAISTNSDMFTLDLTTPKAAARQVTTNGGADGGPQYSPDGKYLSWRMQERAGFESDRWQLVLHDRQTGNRTVVTRDLDRSVDGWVFTPDSKALYLTMEDNASSKVYRQALSGGAPALVLGGGSTGDVQISADGRTLLFTRASLTAPPEIYKANADGTGVAAVTGLNATLLQPFTLRPGESVTYAGAGGTPVQAWIVKPNGFQEGRRYPLLYLVHGGPQGAWTDAWTYRWNAQVFASAGFVVFMPNPRGSTGFGQQFTDEISRDWGGRVYEDLMKGLDYAEKLPYVDASKKVAAGASYGGYMMNWFLGHTNRFKAIVSHAGVFNLTSMYGVTEELWFPEWDLGGTPWDNREGYETWSPHMYAENFRTPTLVTHGELDFRVPVGEGFQLFTTLQRQGVPSRLLYFPDEGHWINRPQNSALWYNTFLEWMERWIK
ncbi:MAG: S9 family peptidase [Acidobacteriota bacterium]